MYMLHRGTPLEDAPNIGGALMQWHIHNNLCYTPAGQVVGITNGDGECAPGLVLPEPTPMIHVWLEPQECGPFAALEGIGGGQIAEGETVTATTSTGHPPPAGDPDGGRNGDVASSRAAPSADLWDGAGRRVSKVRTVTGLTDEELTLQALAADPDLPLATDCRAVPGRGEGRPRPAPRVVHAPTCSRPGHLGPTRRGRRPRGRRPGGECAGLLPDLRPPHRRLRLPPRLPFAFSMEPS